MKTKNLLLAIFFPVTTINAQVIVTDTSSFERVTHYMKVDKTYCSGMHTLEAIFPYMQSNHYQVIKNPVVFSNGQVRDNAEGGNKYIGYSLHTTELKQIGNVFNLGMSFDVATININVNFDAIETIYPYDTTSKEYMENTGNITTCVLPHHPHIEGVAGEIWAQSSDIIDYARRCYEYTATHLNYLANMGIHSLQDVIGKGGGDCGNFSSYYISLLRNRDIPARHVVGVMGQDNYHVWPEFYLQNYGWIPVDPTFKNGNPDGDYFGHKNSPHYITTLGLELTNYKFAESDEPMQLELMQLLYYQWWAYNPCTSTEFDFKIERTPTAIDNSFCIADNSISVYALGKRIFVEGSNGERIQVFDTAGRIVGGSNEGSVTVPTAGVYLVKVGSRFARKLIVVSK
ncbi:MAG: transglutaminase domain-containing protein [Prevotella sp.]|nr:transglutaminase domain-containing protein [Prevotella sp.]